jgi:hypothetical protein
MKILTASITLAELKRMAEDSFGNMVKAVVDIERQIMAVDAELHSDEEALLLQDGSRQQDLWGINLYPDCAGDEFIEYDSMINIRPAHGNKSRGVDSPLVRERIQTVVNKLISQ